MLLVTGANGLLGSRLVFDLVSKGKKVRALKRKTSDLSILHHYFKDQMDLFQTIEWADGDVLDIFSLEDALKDVEQVYHCAAKVSFSPEGYDSMTQTNVKGTANLVNLCLDASVRKLCHVSSVAAIGRALDGEQITEETVWKTSSLNSNYAISKYGAEQEVWRGVAEGLDAVIVNPTIILGWGNWMDGSSSMIRKVHEGLHFYTRGLNGFVDVSDVSKAMINLMDSPHKNQRFILNAENLSYLDFFTMAAGFLNKKAPSHLAGPFLSELAWRAEKIKKIFTGKIPLITQETARTANNRYFYSQDKIRELLGFQFIPVKKSLEMLCAGYLASNK